MRRAKHVIEALRSLGDHERSLFTRGPRFDASVSCAWSKNLANLSDCTVHLKVDGTLLDRLRGTLLQCARH